MASDGPAQDGGMGGVGTVHRVVLEGDNAGSTQGYDVDSGQVVENGGSDPNAEFYLSLKQIISLFTSMAPNGTFCFRGRGFPSVWDIPDDVVGCEWLYANLGGNGPHLTSAHGGDGYLLRDRAGLLLGRLLVVRDTSDDNGHARVEFDFLPK